MPQPIKFYIFVIAAVIILFIIGAFVSMQTVEIGDCKASWYLYTKKVHSDLCPNPAVECDAEPYKQQHNALADMLVCACQKTDAVTKARINDVYYQMSGMNLTTEQVCGSQSSMLMKWNY
jgi:hypothetical protein